MSHSTVPVTDPPTPKATDSRLRPENFCAEETGVNERFSDTLKRILTLSEPSSDEMVMSRTSPSMGGMVSDAVSLVAVSVRPTASATIGTPSGGAGMVTVPPGSHVKLLPMYPVPCTYTSATSKGVPLSPESVTLMTTESTSALTSVSEGVLHSWSLWSVTVPRM